MRNHIVRQLQIRDLSGPVQFLDNFEYREFKRWWKRWPTQLAVWWLKKTHCYAMGRTSQSTFVVASREQKDLAAMIFELVSEIQDWRRLDEGDLVIVMGAKQIKEFMADRDVAINWDIHFRVPVEVRWGQYQGRIFGIDVLVLPYMDGVLVVPKGRVVKEKPGTRPGF